MSTFAPRLFPADAINAAIGQIADSAPASCTQAKPPRTLSVTDTEQARPVELPANAVAFLMEIIEEMAAGRGVTLIPENAVLSTVQVADLLNVSCLDVIKLLEENKIPYQKVDGFRHILAEDVLAYKSASDERREAALNEMVAISQEMGLYD